MKSKIVFSVKMTLDVGLAYNIQPSLAYLDILTFENVIYLNDTG